MSLCDPIPVRFKANADSALSSLSNRSGLKKAELIRIAVDAFLENTERTGVIDQRHFISSVVQETGPVYGGNQINTQSALPSVVPPSEGAHLPKAGKPPKKKPSKKK